MRWTTLRGLEKVTMQAMLVFAAMNLKKMATWLWKSGPHLKQVGFLLVILANTIKQTPTFRLETWEFVFSLEHRYIGAFSFSDLI